MRKKEGELRWQKKPAATTSAFYIVCHAFDPKGERKKTLSSCAEIDSGSHETRVLTSVTTPMMHAAGCTHANNFHISPEQKRNNNGKRHVGKIY
jgi:hypothetical protein